MDDLWQRLQAALTDTYLIERELGGGGMSRTYLARERAFDRRVVVKVLAPELLAGLSVERFRREVLLAAQLQHPHVVPVLTAGDVDGLPWFTMPYVDGESLRQRMAGGPLGLTEIIGVLRDTARALAYAHGQGVVHRDIKPDNVLLSAGSATVTDFGIAKAVNAARAGAEPASPALTMTGMSIGTPTYMSPEQAAGDPNIDARADLYSFGVMAYELLTGRPPFHGVTPARLLAAHMSERPPDVRAERADCPESLAALLMRCLEKEPDARPQTASDLVRVLDGITTGDATAATPSLRIGRRVRLGRALGLWGVATVLVALTAWAAREVLGLPDWSFPGAVALMLAGVPAILGTWYVQRTVQRLSTVMPPGTMGTLALKVSPHVSWRRTWLGGGMAVGGFALAIGGYMVMRAAGIGPFASLQGTGRFGARETVVVADFQSPPDDPSLGPIAAEAVRTDLAQSASLDILSRAELRDAMGRMRLGADSVLPFTVARELATREGATAVLDGAIARLGSRYVLSARLVSALDGDELATFRETAADDDELLPALGRITKAVRAKSGESLRRVRQTNELARVTTSSLPALRKYVQGLRYSDEVADQTRAVTLLQEAVDIDSTFAMAWRKLGAILNNEGLEPARAMAAVEASFRHRDRLTELERHLTEGYYYSDGPRPDWRRARDAYLAASAVPGAGGGGYNNAAIASQRLREHDQAEAQFRSAIAENTQYAPTWTNLMNVLITNGKLAALDSFRQDMRRRFPESEQHWFADYLVAQGDDRWEVMDSIARAANSTVRGASQRIRTARAVANLARLRGRPAESRQWTAQALALSAPDGLRPVQRLEAALDDALLQVSPRQEPEAARATLARALRETSLDSLPSAERPWNYLLLLALASSDTALALRARTDAPADWTTIGQDSLGFVSYLDGVLAATRGDWRAALPKLEDADRRLVLGEDHAALWRGVAFDRLAMPDSAIVWLERFTVMRQVRVSPYYYFGPHIHRRLGELYEQRGDRARAIAQYERFLTFWQRAEPALQPQVREVQARVARLQPPV